MEQTQNPTVTPAEVQAAPVAASDPREGKQGLLLELAVFLFLIVPTPIILSFIPDTGTGAFTPSAIATILNELALMFLVLFFVWRNRESFRMIGWTMDHFVLDLILGVVLFVPVFIGTSLLGIILAGLGLSTSAGSGNPFEPSRTLVDMVLVLVLVIVAALAEETIFRGYIIRRLSGVTGSNALSLILAAIIFSLGHGYEGAAGLITVGVVGILYGAVYLWRKSIVTTMTMHFLNNYLVLFIIPLLFPNGINMPS